MQVILKRIPKNTTHKQILHFVKPCLEGSLFRKLGKIKRISVLVHKHRISNMIEFHVILDIYPEEAAKRAINKLHGQLLNGHSIDVAEYNERCIYNHNNILNNNKFPNLDRRDLTKGFRLISIEQLKDFVWTENAEI